MWCAAGIALVISPIAFLSLACSTVLVSRYAFYSQCFFFPLFLLLDSFFMFFWFINLILYLLARWHFCTIVRAKGTYSPETIRTYFAEFFASIIFCGWYDQLNLPAYSLMVCSQIMHITTRGRFSARVRRAVGGLSAIHLFNRMTDPAKKSGRTNYNEGYVSQFG